MRMLQKKIDLLNFLLEQIIISENYFCKVVMM